MANLVHGWSPGLNGEGDGGSFIDQSRCFLPVSQGGVGFIPNRIGVRLIRY
ncbi:hypothetical protein SynMVIR181_02244 [Synechococcus sp. MVIR-18-1]|nr:hypothetical protein SynMVIR181_02244 [Synechococcus sp. MVIR-18-1]